MLGTILSLVKLSAALASGPCFVDRVEDTGIAIIECADRATFEIPAMGLLSEGACVGGECDPCGLDGVRARLSADDNGGNIKL